MIRSTRLPTVQIIIDVVDPEHPYDYVNVTRFGRKAVVAKRPAAPSVKLGTKPILFERQLKRYSASALQFAGPSGGVIYRRRVSAWKPKGGDWVENTAPQVRQYTNEVMQEVAEHIHKEIAGRKNVRF